MIGRVVWVLMFAWMGLLITLTVMALASVVHTIFQHERTIRRGRHTATSKLQAPPRTGVRS